ncbi:MAG: Trm112 family protein [Pseudomonadota bacterium]
MNQQLLDVICCPATHKALEPVSERTLGALNRAIERGAVNTRDGRAVATALDGGLVTVDGRILYPIDDGIPVLLESESVLLAQLDGM